MSGHRQGSPEHMAWLETNDPYLHDLYLRRPELLVPKSGTPEPEPGTPEHEAWMQAEFAAAMEEAKAVHARRKETAPAGDSPGERQRSARPALTVVRQGQTRDRPEGIKAVGADEVPMVRVRWLEEPLWQTRCFLLLAAPKGAGKGTYLAGLAARVTQAGGRALWIGTEDSAALDIVPRLTVAGAVLKLCKIVIDGGLLSVFAAPVDPGTPAVLK
jgi:hypothetical protein